MKLKRKDGKTVDVSFYNNFDIDEVEILDIKHLKFEGKKTKVDSKLKTFIYQNKLLFNMFMKFRAKLIEKPLQQRISQLKKEGKNLVTSSSKYKITNSNDRIRENESSIAKETKKERGKSIK